MEPVQRPIVVIGGGIVGCAIALHLADRGVRPVLVDPGGDRDGASAVSFALISAFSKDPVAYYELACAGMNEWQRWAGRLGGDLGFHRGGQVRWAADPAAGEALAARVRLARARGYPVRPLDGAALRRLLPAARPGDVSAACHAPRDAVVEAPRVVAACRDALARAGGRLLLGHHAQLGVDEQGVRVAVGDEVLYPSTTVLAAGAESAGVAAATGIRLPLTPSPGALVVTTPTKRLTDGVVYLPAGPGPAVHLRQRPDGSVLIGERSQEMIAADLSQAHARALLAQAAHFFPALAGVRVERLIVGWRPMPADRLPLVGRMPGLPSLYLAITHSGVTLAPVLGRLVAEELAGGGDRAELALLAPFRPGRFAERASQVLLDVESVFRGRGDAQAGQGTWGER